MLWTAPSPTSVPKEAQTRRAFRVGIVVSAALPPIVADYLMGMAALPSVWPPRMLVRFTLLRFAPQ